MKKKILFILVLVMAVVSLAVVYLTRDNDEERIGKINSYSRDYIHNQQKQKEQDIAENKKLVEKLKGVVCWGGSNTRGSGTINYVDMLYDSLRSDGYDIPVENMGVSNESSLDILGRQGSIPIVVGANTQIQGTVSNLNEIKVQSSNGQATNILCGVNNPGVNPCTINGIEGTLFGASDEKDDTKTAAFYFQREKKGETIIIPKGAVVQTAGSDKKYKDYINILWLERKGWNTPEELLEQEKSFVNSVNGRYIIIGLTDGGDEENAKIDRIMEKNFGDKYINSRKLLVDYAKERINKSTLNTNREKIEKGEIPSDLADNRGMLSVSACKVLSKEIYERITYLGYLK